MIGRDLPIGFFLSYNGAGGNASFNAFVFSLTKHDFFRKIKNGISRKGETRRDTITVAAAPRLQGRRAETAGEIFFMGGTK